ncbi:hypothetical protein FJZ33_10530, partial [Candidatus Poribacteria bacterium]|nr:hypothetical protein [Candidatus Poribacteria bacterium]
AYSAVGKNLYEALQANTAYNGIMSPDTLNHRYITEDVPMSLVPMASIGDMLGVPTPTIKAIIQLASNIHNTDYMKQGRSAEKLGITGLSVKEIRRFVLEGLLPNESVKATDNKKTLKLSKILPLRKAGIGA